MPTIPTATLTIDEFLAISEEKPYREYLRGEVMEKPLGNDLHGSATARLITEFGNHLDATGEGVVRNEVRHAARSEDWVYLPDIHIHIRTGSEAELAPQPRGVVERAPDFGIEVLSPDDRPQRWIERVSLYMRAGTRLLWIVDPREETIRVYRPGMDSRMVRAGDVLDGEPVLKGFKLDVGAFFAKVHRRR